MSFLFPKKGCMIGVDLGGTKTEVVVVSNHNILLRNRFSTPQEQGYSAILNAINDGIQSAIKECNLSLDDFDHIGIGTPGSLNPKTGILRNSNTLCMNGQPLKVDLEKVLGKSVIIENDANCFALAEQLLGAGKGHRVVFGVIIGTGAGGGIVVEGKVITGAQSIAGEWGHNVVDQNGPDCYCGKRGCVERMISGSGIQKSYLLATGQKLSAQEIFDKAGIGQDDICINLKEQFLENFGRGLAQVINILDPDVIVLGGGLSNVDFVYTEGVKRVLKYVFSTTPEANIVKNELGDSAGVFGAALL